MAVNTTSAAKRAWRRARALSGEALLISWELFRVMLPVSVAAKVLADLGAVDVLGRALSPVMALAGLPGTMGVVWATAMLTNLYGGMAAFVTLAAVYPVTTAQATVLALMMLVAHSLPVELRVTQKAGAGLGAMAILRVGGALVMGIVLNAVYQAGGWLQEPVRVLVATPTVDPSWMAWGVATARSLLLMFVVILSVLAGMKLLDRLGLTRLMVRALEPLLERLGIGPQAAPLAIIGMMLGLSYGGGLIIRECRRGQVGSRDAFYSLALMGLVHAVVEDTFLMVSIGAAVSGVGVARLIMALLITALIVRVTRRWPDDRFRKHLLARRGGQPDDAA